MPEEAELKNISEHHPRKRGLGLPEFNVQNALILILVLALVGLGLYLFKPDLFKAITGQGSTAKTPQKQEVKPSGYSAVFLVNNQVYFGKLEDAGGLYPKLKDVYYLRVDRPLQPAPATGGAQPEVQLIKLGNELHGPVDEIRFNKEQILYIEDLKTDSRVVKAIEDFKKRNP